MSHLVYLLSLLGGIAGLLVIDHRFNLAFFADTRRTIKTLLPAIAIFVIWDFAGIALGIFYHGDSRYSLPFTIAPEFPVEEILFLFLLCYTTLILYTGVRRWKRT